MKMDEIRVIQFIRDLSDGGAETLVKEYVRLLDKKVFHPYIVTIRNYTNTAVYKQISELGVEIIPVYSNWNVFIKIFNKIFGKRYIDYKLKRIIAKINPNCIHAHLYTLDYLYRVADSLKNIKLFYTCHSVPQRYFGPNYPKQTDAAIYLIKHKGMRMIALHDEMKMELNKMFEIENVVTIKNGIDITRYRDVNESKNAIRASIGISKEAFVVGNVSRFIELKNHTFLLDIFKEIYKKNINAHLLLIGDGELKEKIVDKINSLNLKDNVTILSHRDDVFRLMKAMDVFIFPSKVEGFGIVAIEAQAAGIRCLMSDTVPASTYISKYAIPISLECSAEEWAQIAINSNVFSNYTNRISEYDLRSEIRKLEKLYLN